MMNEWNRRAISLLLAFALLMTMLPSGVFPVNSVETESGSTSSTESETTETVSTAAFDHLIGRTATFSDYYDTFTLAAEPSTVSGYSDISWTNAVNYSVYDYIGDDSALTDDEYYALFDAFYATEMVIKEIYISTEVHGALWFLMEAPEGGTLPEIFQTNPWIFAFYSGLTGEEKNITLNVKHADLLTGVSVEGAPEDTELVVEVPTVDGTALDGVFDIKMYDKDGNEWQPIDHDMTVTISIPVEGVEDGGYVDVYHFIDYAPDIDGDEKILSTEGAGADWLEILQPALNAYGDGVNVAVEVTEKVTTAGNIAFIETDSFSVFYYNGTTYGDSDGNQGNPINFTANNALFTYDEGKTYFVTRGTTVYCYRGRNYTYESSVFTIGDNVGEWYDPIYPFYVSDKAPFYTRYTIASGDVEVYFVVMPELTVNFKCNIDTPGLTITLPAAIDGIFMGNSDTHNPDADPPQYAALNYTFKAPTMTGDASEAYSFKYWYVEHYPSKTFKAEQTVYLSNSTLEVDMQDGIDSYTVNLVAWYDLTNYTITYNLNGETVDTTGYPTTYTIEETLNIPTPTSSSREFLGWKVTTADGNWTQDDVVLGGETLQNMHGNVTLTAQWAEETDVTYKVEHYVQDTSLNTDLSTYLLYDTDIMVGTPGDLTSAVTKNILGFTAPTSITQVEVAEDGSTVVKVYYTRNTYTITFDSTGGTAVAPITQPYGATITKPYEPTKTGYNFHYWYTADAPGVEYEFNTMPAEDLTLYAQWTVKQVTVTFLYDDSGNIYFTSFGEANAEVDVPANPTKAGYTFTGWHYDADGDKVLDEGELYVPSTEKFNLPTADRTVTAQWEPVEYKVTFDTQGGTMLNGAATEYTVTINSALSALPEAEMTGYDFGGWYANKECTGTAYTLDTLTDALFAETDYEITVYAKWTPASVTYKVYTYVQELDGSYTESIETKNGTTGDTVTLYPEGKDGFGINEDKSVLSGTVAADGSLVLKVYYDRESYTIDATIDNGTISGKQDSYLYGASASVTFTPATGYKITKITVNGVEQSIDSETQYIYTNDSMGSDVTIEVITEKITYTVTWNNYNGNEISSNDVSYGATVTAPSDPSRESDAQYHYIFCGWEDENGNQWDADYTVTGDVTFTAQYTPVTNEYTVTWYDHDKTTVLETDEKVAYGTTPSYDGDTPTRADAEGYGYTFTGWSPVISKVVNDVQYYAVYEKSAITYTIIYKDGDTEDSDTYTVEDALTLPTPTKTGYTFAGWKVTTADGNWVDGEVYSGTLEAGMYGNVTLEAQWTVNSYTIKFVDEDGTVLSEKSYEYGTLASAIEKPVEPTKAGNAQYSYTFAGWSPAITDVTGDATYTAIYTETVNEYTITFQNEDGTVLQSGKVAYGTMPAYTGATPTKEGNAQYSYTFKEWSPALTSVTGEATYTATFKEITNTYTVTWKNEDGTVLETDENVPYGTTPSYDGEEPAKAATAKYTYTFKDWTPAVSTITGDVTYTATYTEAVNKYVIKFVNHDNAVLQSIEVEYGTVPVYTGTTPTKSGNAQYSYTFNGWDKALAAVTGEATYMATFTEVTNTYTVTWKNEDGTVLETDENVPYGTVPTYDGSTPTKASTAEFNYAFDKWTPEVVAVTGDATYTATYTQTKRQYEVKINFVDTMVNAEGAGFYEYGATAVIKITPKDGYEITSITINGEQWVTFNPNGDTYNPTVYDTIVIVVTAKIKTYDVNYDLGLTAERLTNEDAFATGQVKEHFKAINLYTTVPTANGATFKGWATTEKGSVVYQPGDLYAEEASVTLYAVWEPTPMQVNYSANGLPVGTSAQFNAHSGFYGDKFPVQTPDVAGYKVCKITVDGNEVTVPYEIVLIDSDVNVVVTYEPVVYTITFDENGGSEVVDQEYTIESVITLPSTGRTGYVFKGWSVTSTDGNWTGSNLTGTIPAGEYGNVTLTAQWTPISYTITFDENGGDTVADQKYDIEDPITLPTPTRTGYSFNGWKVTHTDGNWVGDDLTGEIGAGKYGTVTLQAQWTPNTDTKYVVNHYQQNINGTYGAAHETENLTGTTGDKVTPDVKTYTGFTSPAVQEVTITADGSLVVNYYYERISYTVTWMDGYNDTPIRTDTVKYGDNVPASPSVTREGHTFSGWDMSIPSTMPASDLTITALWTPKKFTLTGSIDNGTVDGPFTVNYGEPASLTFTPDAGYSLTHWKSDIGSSGTFSPPNQSSWDRGWDKLTQDITVTVYTSPIDYTITFDANGGNAVNSVTYNIEKSVTLPTPTRYGYTFSGWKVTTASGNWTKDEEITSGTVATGMYGNVTLTAQWTEILQDLTITKIVNNIGENPIPAGQQFTFVFTMPNGTTYAQYKDNIIIEGASISEGESSNQFKVTITINEEISAGTKDNPGTVEANIVIKNLPLGDYTVEELYQKGFDGYFDEDTDNDDKVTVTLAEGLDGSVKCTNTYPVYTGDLTIINDVKPKFDGDTNYKDDVHTIVITLTPAEEALAVVQKYYYSIDGGTPIELDFTDETWLSFEIELKAGQSVTISDLPIGQYSVARELIKRGDTDVKSQYDNLGVSYEPADQVIRSDEDPDYDKPVATVSSTYLRTTGTLTITKEVSNAGTSDIAVDESFHFLVTIPTGTNQSDFPGVSWYIDENGIESSTQFIVTISISGTDVADGTVLTNSVSLSDIPSGVYTVKEIKIEGFHCDDYEREVTVLPAGASVTFSNSYPVYEITYQVSGNAGDSTLTSSGENVTPGKQADGSTANPADGYKFIGWYTDAECTAFVSYDATLKPEMPAGGWSQNLIYYAKFEPTGSLKITKTVNNTTSSTLSGTHIFTFEVTMPGGLIFEDYVTSPPAGVSTGDVTNDDKFIITITFKDIPSGETSQHVLIENLPHGTYVLEEINIAEGFRSSWTGKKSYILDSDIGEILAVCTNEYPVYDVNYIVQGGGSVTLVGTTTGSNEVSESYNYVNGAPAGAFATANDGYTFKGWYYDKEGTQPVAESLVSNATLKPIKLEQDQTFYAVFEEIKVTISYVIVGPDGSKYSVDQNWAKLSAYSQTVGVVTGTPSATVQVLDNAYKFIGWYDADGNAMPSGATCSPAQVDGLHVSATYYAKFEYNLTTLTIHQQTVDQNGNPIDYETVDPNQTFLFRLTGKDENGNDISLDVTVHGNGEVTIEGLVVGNTYTITEITNWSWRYACKEITHSNVTVNSKTSGAITIMLGVGGTITFTNERTQTQWLDGDDWFESLFGSITQD